MKKVLKSRIFAFILGAVIFGTIGVLADNIFASSINYTPEWKKGNGENITNVAEAIDELYNKSSVYVAMFNEQQLKTTTTYKLTNTYLNSSYGYIDTNGDLVFTQEGTYKIIGIASDGGSKSGGDVFLYAYLDNVLLTEGEAYNTSNPNYTRATTYSAMNNIYSYVLLNQNVQVHNNSKLQLSMAGEWNDTSGSMVSTVIIIKI